MLMSRMEVCCLMMWFHSVCRGQTTFTPLTVRAGLISIFKHCHKDLLPPREKITCLLVGNHSAGKSSFINW